MTFEVMFFYIMCGVVFIFSSVLLYYLRLYRNKLFLTEKEYQNAKNIIKNIVITFNKRQEENENKIEDILYNIEKIASGIELLDSTNKERGREIFRIEDGVKNALLANSKMVQRLLDMDERLRSNVISRRELSNDLPDYKELNSRVRQENTTSLQVPYWNKGVLNGLTDTEKQILTILVKEGEKVIKSSHSCFGSNHLMERPMGSFISPGGTSSNVVKAATASAVTFWVSRPNILPKKVLNGSFTLASLRAFTLTASGRVPPTVMGSRGVNFGSAAGFQVPISISSSRISITSFPPTGFFPGPTTALALVSIAGRSASKLCVFCAADVIFI